MYQKEVDMLAAEEVLKHIPHQSDYIVFGSGKLVKEVLNAYHRSDLFQKVVCASMASDSHAKGLGLDVEDIDKVTEHSVYIDTADQIDNEHNMIKGSITSDPDVGVIQREKELVNKVGTLLIVAKLEKMVDKLDIQIPIEFHPQYEREVMKYLLGFSNNIKKRLAYDGRPFVTEQGNNVFDIKLKDFDPVDMEIEFNATHHVISNGLFAVRKPDCIVLTGESVIVRKK